MKLIVTALNPENGRTDEIEVEKDRSEKIIRKMNACKWFVDDSDQTSDSLHAIGINQYDLGCLMTNNESTPLSKCKGFHVFVDGDFPNTKSPSEMHIEHGNSYFTQSKQIIKFDSIDEQCKFWDNMMSNLMTPEEIELLHRADLEISKNDATSNVENYNGIELEIGRIVDLYEIDVVTKMMNSLDKCRNACTITILEKKAISLWEEYIGKFGKKRG